ncbi:hypothetical protein IQ255_10395 [Pleurocapsales cyanobacterium LEGE 10410]|nr:hypothetical protein [Pleurocapsales cyanobacterium LEGE 10410]
MGTLTTDDLRQCRDFFKSLSEGINDLLRDLIDDVTRDELIKQQQDFSDISIGLTAEVLEIEIKDLATPMAKIQESIDKVNEALHRLSDVRKGIDLFTELVNFGSKLVSAVSGGGVVPILGTVLQAVNLKADNLS